MAGEGFVSMDLDLNLGLEPTGALAAAPAGKKAAPKAKLHKGKIEYAPPFYTINIAHVEGLPEFETVSVNGEALQITRGVDVDNIPHAYVGVLKNAVASRQVKKVRPDGTEYFEWQPYPAIPYQIIGAPYTERKVAAKE